MSPRVRVLLDLLKLIDLAAKRRGASDEELSPRVRAALDALNEFGLNEDERRELGEVLTGECTPEEWDRAWRSWGWLPPVVSDARGSGFTVPDGGSNPPGDTSRAEVAEWQTRRIQNPPSKPGLQRGKV